MMNSMKEIKNEWSDTERLGEERGVLLQQVTYDPRRYFWRLTAATWEASVWLERTEGQWS